MNSGNPPVEGFGFRLKTAIACFSRALGNPAFARQAADLLEGRAGRATSPTPAPAPSPVQTPTPTPAPPKPVELPPERGHASALAVVSHLQREGRLIDFLQEDVAAFSDAEVGAAARVVHSGCRKAFQEYFTVEAILKEAEGASVQVPAGFDAQRIRLTGNVAGQPPFRGTLKHHGWAVTRLNIPTLPESLDPRVVAAAEVEL